MTAGSHAKTTEALTFAVLQVRDGFGRTPLTRSDVVFDVDGKRCLAINKGGGFYVFLGFADASSRRIGIHCSGFFDTEVLLSAIRLPLLASIHVCELEPSPLYVYPTGTTLLRGCVMHSGAVEGAVCVTAQADGRQTSTQTYGEGEYEGRYAVVLNLDEPEQAVTLMFTKEGCGSATKQVSAARGVMTIIDDVEI